MPEELPAFEPYEVSVGTVIDHQSDPAHYIVRLSDGRVVGIPGTAPLSVDAFEAAASPFVANNSLQ